MDTPTQLRKYACDDYFTSEWAKDGFWDEPAQLTVIAPAREVGEGPDLSFLVVGRPGVDGIEFGYRAGHPGLWAYYPIDAEFVPVANTVAELIADWKAGRLIV